MSEPVKISYNDLLDSQNYAQLEPLLLEAFGTDQSLGLLVIDDIPSAFTEIRQRCLDKANAFASLPAEIRDRYTDASSSYSFGWSLGRESFEGKPDLAKGSYYAHPTTDTRLVDSETRMRNPEYFNNNRWPSEEDCPGYREAFLALSGFLLDVGIKLARALDSIIQDNLPEEQKHISVADLIASSQTSKARLLYYFPLPGQTVSLDSSAAPVASSTGNEDNLCANHLDHSLITALCPAQYLYHPSSNPSSSYTIPCPSETAGLFIKPRSASESIRATFPPNCIAFQTGEALELLSGGKLKATPHAVRAGNVNGRASERVREALEKQGVKEGEGVVSRQTMAVFLQPDIDTVLDSTTGETFGQFTKRILESHY